MMNPPNPGSNGFSGLYDRSISTSGFENSRNSGFERQMSVPSNLAEQGNKMPPMNNGYGQQRGPGAFGGGGNGGDSFGYGGMSTNSMFQRSGIQSGSPPSSSNGRNPGFNDMKNPGFNDMKNPGFNDMKIGTWNDGAQSGNGQMNGGTGNNFPSVGNFEIGTFNISNSHNSTQQRSNGFNEHQPPGPGHRETGIIEKLLVSTTSNFQKCQQTAHNHILNLSKFANFLFGTYFPRLQFRIFKI